MPDMADAVTWTAIPLGVAAAAGYLTIWPASAWGSFKVPLLTISRDADPAAMAFDVEVGLASPTKMAGAVAGRFKAGLPSVPYCVESTMTDTYVAVKAAGVPWLTPADWPKPGAYLWAGAGSKAVVGQVPAWCPVQPVAVQDRYLGAYDLSTLMTRWLPVPVIPPQPAPPLIGGLEIVSLSIGTGLVVVEGVSAGHKFVMTAKVATAGTPAKWSIQDLSAEAQSKGIAGVETFTT